MAILVFLVGLVAPFFIHGFVLIKLWSWFIVDLFNLPQITLGHAVGLAIIASYLTWQYDGDLVKEVKRSETERQVNAVFSMVFNLVFRPLLVLLVGWIASGFV